MNNSVAGAPGRPLLSWTALGLVYLLWGLTYLAIRVGVHGLPPLVLAGVRYVIAGGLLYPVARRAAARGRGPGPGSGKPGARAWFAGAVVGILLFLAGPTWIKAWPFLVEESCSGCWSSPGRSGRWMGRCRQRPGEDQHPSGPMRPGRRPGPGRQRGLRRSRRRCRRRHPAALHAGNGGVTVGETTLPSGLAASSWSRRSRSGCCGLRLAAAASAHHRQIGRGPHGRAGRRGGPGRHRRGGGAPAGRHHRARRRRRLGVRVGAEPPWPGAGRPPRHAGRGDRDAGRRRSAAGGGRGQRAVRRRSLVLGSGHVLARAGLPHWPGLNPGLHRLRLRPVAPSAGHRVHLRLRQSRGRYPGRGADPG